MILRGLHMVVVSNGYWVIGMLIYDKQYDRHPVYAERPMNSSVFILGSQNRGLSCSGNRISKS